jgi:hypothetical protein
MQLTWLGHSAVHLDIAGRSVLIDPFWTGNPKHPEGFEDSLGQVDFIVLTMGIRTISATAPGSPGNTTPPWSRSSRSSRI